MEGIKNAWDLIKASIRVFNKYPKFLIPLLLVWLIYAPIILYLEYGFNPDAFSAGQLFLIIIGIIFLFVFLLAFSCLVLLELIQQLESGEKLSLGKALSSTVTHDLLKIIPIVIIWTIIWFILSILEAIFSKRKERRKSFTVENAAKTLAGYGNFSPSSAFFRELKRGVRMIVFLILPAIAWENLSFIKAIKKGLGVFKVHLLEFVSGFVLTWLAEVIIFLPAAILFHISDNFEVTFPTWVWVITIIYTGFAWSFSIYLEQMFAAGLYLWHLKWEKQIEEEKKLGKPLSNLRDIKRPSLLDEVPELLEK
jgi:preprotein translocase subunit SecG